MLNGDEIRQARQRAGMSQAELAAIVGVSMRSIGNYERGETIPRNRMPQIEDALGAYLGTSENAPTLAAASDAALLAEIARRFDRGKEQHRGNTAPNTQAGESPAGEPRKPLAGRGPGVDAREVGADSQPRLVVAPDDL